jgi:putative flavoprotein involved in K+ transport
VEVRKVERNTGRPDFTVETSDGVLEVNRVVASTGPFQTPVIPPIAPAEPDITQIHSAEYRNAGQLPEGAVLVVGAGSAGAQIADDLQRAGRQVYLSVGPHHRPPRAYRGRDFTWWLGVLGEWEQEAMKPGTEHVTIAVSGAHGGRTVDFRTLAHQGMTLVGRTKCFDNGIAIFERDLPDNIAAGGNNFLSLLDAADDHAARNGLDLPEEPEARRIPANPECVTHPVLELDLAAAGVHTIVWATGFATDFGWLNGNGLDADGNPRHRRGISGAPGIYLLGLPWLSNRSSNFIWGVWHDAKHIADHVGKQRKYVVHRWDRSHTREVGPIGRQSTPAR